MSTTVRDNPTQHRGLAVVPLCPYVRKVIAVDASRDLHLVPDHVRKPLDLAHPPT